MKNVQVKNINIAYIYFLFILDDNRDLHFSPMDKEMAQPPVTRDVVVDSTPKCVCTPNYFTTKILHYTRSTLWWTKFSLALNYSLIFQATRSSPRQLVRAAV